MVIRERRYYLIKCICAKQRVQKHECVINKREQLQTYLTKQKKKNKERMRKMKTNIKKTEVKKYRLIHVRVSKVI